MQELKVSIPKVKMLRFQDEGYVMHTEIFSKATRPVWKLDVSTPSIFYQIR
jgi:hypothetical protein